VARAYEARAHDATEALPETWLPQQGHVVQLGRAADVAVPGRGRPISVPSDPPAVVLLGDRSAITASVAHALAAHLAGRARVTVILEESPSRLTLARRRARRLGWWTVAGQIAFVGLVMPVLHRRGHPRVVQIAQENRFDLSPVKHAFLVDSVNDERTIALLDEAAPALVVVHGTRIIARSVLKAINVPVMNVHAGITPRYRGVHGGYWALCDGRPDLAGSTVHLVDAGIDTGDILAQTTFTPAGSDSIATYPYLHVACALPLLLDQVDAVLAGAAPATVPPLPGAEASELRWHPTAWGYLKTRRGRGVR
jgi:folate-dependent phosphoribosylglycinamide formyltransferase PurN